MPGPSLADASCERCTTELARLLRSLAHVHRLAVLCHLARSGESRVGALAQAAARAGGEPSQSALSQHLARLRAEGLVVARRDAQGVWYRLADPRVERLLAVLTAFPCPQCDKPAGVFAALESKEMRR